MASEPGVKGTSRSQELTALARAIVRAERERQRLLESKLAELDAWMEQSARMQELITGGAARREARLRALEQTVEALSAERSRMMVPSPLDVPGRTRFDASVVDMRSSVPETTTTRPDPGGPRARRGVRIRRLAGDFREITVSEARRADADSRSRVSADVRGSELWFETADVELTASTEMFATALLPIAAGAGATIELEGALDPVWRRNAARILRVWNGWRGYEPAIDAIVKAPEAQLGRGPAALDTGLCFTLGVDSFYTLMRAADELDALILAHGYDIPRADRARIDDARSSLVAVAEATGCRAVIVETNLREHPVGVQMDWERGHGGAIAAVGHACEGLIGRLSISPRTVLQRPALGLALRTDQGWSSSRLQVEHYGADLRRAEKLGEIADEPLVQQHLRVCWEHRSSSANCGECEKRLRTMVSLVNHRALERFPASRTTAWSSGSTRSRPRRRRC